MRKLFLPAVVLVLALLWVGSAFTEEEKNTYVGDNEKKCAMCHKDQVTAWKAWGMAKAFDLLSDEEKKKPECLACHTTGYGQPGGFVDMEKTPTLVGVQCESCHGPMGLHMKAPLTDKEARKATTTPPTAEMCQTCHKKEGNPNFKEFKYEEAVKALDDHKKKS